MCSQISPYKYTEKKSPDKYQVSIYSKENPNRCAQPKEGVPVRHCLNSYWPTATTPLSF